jgi:hypothetical protein
MYATPVHPLTHSPIHPALASPFADRLFRIAFTLAGFYNLAFGLWAAVLPLAFFQVFDIAPPRYPGIWACLGMVVGVYGLLYWYAAWKLNAAWPIIAVALLGKVLGPIGMVLSLGDDWPRRLGMICVFNDLIWWLPFGLFLIRSTWVARWLVKAAPWICVATHVAALGALAFYLRPGTQSVSDMAARATYVSTFFVPWSIGWGTWMVAAASLVGFYASWGGYVVLSTESSASAHDSRKVRTLTCTAAVLIAALGMACDFAGEASLILRLTEHAKDDLAAFIRVERQFTILSAGAANGLYTIGGILLTLVTPNLPRWVRWLMWLTWVAGIAMTVAAVANSVPGLMVFTAALFPPFLVWVTWMGARWPAASSAERRPA